MGKNRIDCFNFQDSGCFVRPAAGHRTAILGSMPEASTIHSTATTTLLQRYYALARQHSASAASRVVLHLGAQCCGIAVGTATGVPTITLLPLGCERTAAELFKTTPPTPLALEHAIQVVEDVVMPLRPAIPRDAQLYCCDVVVRDIALLSGVVAEAGVDPHGPLVLSLDAMERSFDRLAAVVQGRPAASAGLPASNAFAMALLILREFMHHQQFAQVTLLMESPGP